MRKYKFPFFFGLIFIIYIDKSNFLLFNIIVNIFYIYVIIELLKEKLYGTCNNCKQAIRQRRKRIRD